MKLFMKGRTLPIPRFLAPFVDLFSDGHEFLCNYGVAEMCSSSPTKKAMDSASFVVLEAWKS